ncbi:VOC family protein [Phyllobacterium sp. 22552]|uniref:VOC family protein n=1 Tax=Phyllobacterium sp. 22552 TaxID=3453941 RepID=UPI003F870790
MTSVIRTEQAAQRYSQPDMKLEVIVIPVADVDRAKDFYASLHWRLDADVSGKDSFRVVQFTPPGSPCSVIFGNGVTSAVPGSARGLHLIVSDIIAAHAAVAERGIEISEPFHDIGGVFHHSDQIGRLKGTHPTRSSYSTFASFNDPDGNEWIFQEVTARLPGRVEAANAAFTSFIDLAGALRRAAAAHGQYEARSGGVHDETWPDWYADYIWKEQTGQPLPS